MAENHLKILKNDHLAVKFQSILGLTERLTVLRLGIRFCDLL